MSTEAATGRSAIARAIERLGVVAVIRLTDPRTLRAVVEALREGGVRAIEVTMTVPHAVELIRELAATLPEDCLLGAGTVTDPATARAVIDAGARFVVGPVFRPDVVRQCHQRDVLAMPGCFSPTEILAAHEEGAEIVKLFPATMLGPQFLRDVRAPLPQVKLLPTGGVTPENAGEWIRAGAVAVGIGSALVDKHAIDQAQFAVITEKARLAVANVAAARDR